YLNYNFSIAVGVGFIALAGVAVEIGVIMLVYLNQAWHHKKLHAEENQQALQIGDLTDAIREGAGLRVRPVMMTVLTVIIGLIPIMYGSGTGSQVMQRIAAPMIGGMASALLLTLLVLPAIFKLWKQREVNKTQNPEK
ncbi:TPA: efflux RND transporter permease subunit, partial [Vibrio parahaemolyticus]|nr:efflux RND transporter permease subunit [Vibrio parahaemolyticus]